MDGAVLLGGRYEVRGVLGRGGMAEVRDGLDTRLGRAVAIKLLHPSGSTSAATHQRFHAEARAAASLNHPNIVSVFDSGDHRGTPYIIMERLPGGTLADELARGPLPSARVRTILEDVLGALATAHAGGILHRDIKPGNILLTTTGDTVKVADFGIAKTVDAAYTKAGEILGTMAYLSPERVGGAPAAIADDLYAVGVIGYEALMGRPPFRSNNLGALARAIMDDVPPPIETARPDVEPNVVSVINRAMSRIPHQRFCSAEEMLAAVRGDLTQRIATTPGIATTQLRSAPIRPPTRVLDTPFTQPPASLVYVPPPRRKLSGRTKALLGAGAAIAALMTAIAFALNSPAPSTDSPEPASTSTAVTTPPTSASPSPPAVQPPQEPDDQQVAPGNKGHGNGKKGHKGG